MNVWVDLETTPNVLFFHPIIERLKKVGHSVVVTARDYAQTKDLADIKGLDCICVGKPPRGKSKILKSFKVIQRTLILSFLMVNKRIDVSMGHNSRGVVLASFLLRTPNITFLDYEHMELAVFRFFASRIYVPYALPMRALVNRGVPPEKIVSYSGLKENVYVGELVIEPDFLEKIGVPSEKVIVTLRPPSTRAHYHDERGDELFFQLLDYLKDKDDLAVLLTLRFPEQRKLIEERLGTKMGNIKIIDTVDGLNLVWHSDIVISGGGTMNREAAVMGVPAYTIFTGKQPSVEKELVKLGKIKKIDSEMDFQSIILRKREVETRHDVSLHFDKTHVLDPRATWGSERLVNEIVDYITEFVSEDRIKL